MSKRLKFDIGERVKIRKDLVVDDIYYMDNGEDKDQFTQRMSEFAGKEAGIMKIEQGKYKLDIDPIHYYTDDMLKRLVDNKARRDYNNNREVEALISHVLKRVPKQIKKDREKKINDALDNKDMEMFIRLTAN